MKAYCGTFFSTKGCAMLVGVEGYSEAALSSFRIRSFLGKDRINLDKPRVVSKPKSRDEDEGVDYFWYLITAQTGEFDLQLSVGSTTGDPDLFVAAYDGRLPNEDDWDYMSKMEGADTLRIASTDNFWTHKDTNTSRGVLITIGVKFKPDESPLLELDEDDGQYTLLISDNTRSRSVRRIDFEETQIVNLPATPDNAERNFE
jgi:hypothetical protein